MLLIPSGIFSLCHGTMASASWGLFFPPFSTDVWKWGLWTCEAASNTEPESCGRLSVALTRLKFLLPHSLETWRFMIAVVCLSLLWLPYLSQKNPTKKQKTQNKAKKNPHQTGHLEQQQYFTSHSGHWFPLTTVRENPSWQWLAFPDLQTHRPNGYRHPWHLPCVLPNAFSLWSCQTA